jgi:stringent starvation protein B
MARLRPYLLKATQQWLVEHDLTPYLLVDTEQKGVVVPKDHVKNGRIVLNLSPVAVKHLIIDHEGISFEASFGGISQQLFVPIAAVMALYSKETGHGIYEREEGIGMNVNEGETENDLDPCPPEVKPKHNISESLKKANALGLRVVK